MGLAWLVAETHWLRVVRLKVPVAGRGRAVRVVQLSDLHGRTRFLNGRISTQVNALKPDVVCVTGDLVSHQSDLPRVLAELRRLECPRIYFVPGNWERETLAQGRKRLMTLAETDALLRRVSRVARVLLNAGEVLDIGGLRLLIYGFDNSLEGLDAYHPPIQSADARLLLAHSPLIIQRLRSEALPYDLLLTGDTHGGQIRVLGRTRPDVQRWHVGAERQVRGGVFYISRGLGTTHLPLRLGSPPELLCADLVPSGPG
ncbi:metallophosphoesterase [Deinococcus alpinitundrae]|uniref:metallophosphoesterase n=1 Tax=Deinococcus alpinitundrae TaxID=468913 RepID=UPI001379E180|nr:metallophosphoesterase [Deinococcus alpinitundrae]